MLHSVPAGKEIPFAQERFFLFGDSVAAMVVMSKQVALRALQPSEPWFRGFLFLPYSLLLVAFDQRLTVVNRPLLRGSLIETVRRNPRSVRQDDGPTNQQNLWNLQSSPPIV